MSLFLNPTITSNHYKGRATAFPGALQVFAARRYSRDCPVQRVVRDARMVTIAGDTVQMRRNLVANRLRGRADQP
jgi:alkylation response protein AidB-like acyl-CoA dehydrogenase